jgi:hypothetical protein
MLIEQLSNVLFTPTAKTSRSRLMVWFSLSLTFAALYGMLLLADAFSGDYVVQDDARQHVFWMRRFLDPQLFPNDLIADYFQSVAPEGYTTLYRAFAAIGVDPLLLSKLLPPILIVISAGYAFWVCLEILPIPVAGFIASLLIDQILWLHDDVASATPRAFMPPIFLAFLYYLMRRSLIPCLVAIALEGLFYPQYVFVFSGIVALQPLDWQQGRLRLSRRKIDYWFCGAGLVVAFLVLLPFALETSQYGPTIKAAEAIHLPEFGPDGRSRFYLDDPWTFWLSGNRSGLFPTFKPLFLAAGVLVPVLLRFPDRLPLARQITSNIRVLLQIVLVALALFAVAHAVLFKLHLPSRYTTYTFRFALAFAAAISLTLLLDAALRWLAQPKPRLQQVIGLGLTLCLGLALLIYPAYAGKLAKPNYETGDHPDLYQFFAQQPKDSVTASISKEVSNLPTFAERSILVGKEYAIPYHLGYANQFRQRVEALIQAQYSLNAADLDQFIRTYHINFWLLDRDAFKPSYFKDNWIDQYPTVVKQAQKHLKKGTPALKKTIDRCTVFRDNDKKLTVLSADCILTDSATRLNPS